MREEAHRLTPGWDLRIFEDNSHAIGGDEQDMLLDVIKGFIVDHPFR